MTSSWFFLSILDTPCSEVQCKTTGHPLHSHFPPSLPLPCDTVCHHISTELFYCDLSEYPEVLVCDIMCLVERIPYFPSNATPSSPTTFKSKMKFAVLTAVTSEDRSLIYLRNVRKASPNDTASYFRTIQCYIVLIYCMNLSE